MSEGVVTFEAPLSQGFGYGIILGLGFAFALVMIFITWALKRLAVLFCLLQHKKTNLFILNLAIRMKSKHLKCSRLQGGPSNLVWLLLQS